MGLLASMWNPSGPRIKPDVPCNGRRILIHSTTREGQHDLILTGSPGMPSPPLSLHIPAHSPSKPSSRLLPPPHLSKKPSHPPAPAPLLGSALITALTTCHSPIPGRSSCSSLRAPGLSCSLHTPLFFLCDLAVFLYYCPSRAKCMLILLPPP